MVTRVVGVVLVRAVVVVEVRVQVVRVLAGGGGARRGVGARAGDLVLAV